MPLNEDLKLEAGLCGCVCVLSRGSYCFYWRSNGCWQCSEGSLMVFPLNWDCVLDKDGVPCVCVRVRNKEERVRLTHAAKISHKEVEQRDILFSHKPLSHASKGNNGPSAKPEHDCKRLEIPKDNREVAVTHACRNTDGRAAAVTRYLLLLHNPQTRTRTMKPYLQEEMLVGCGRMWPLTNGWLAQNQQAHKLLVDFFFFFSILKWQKKTQTDQQKNS